jgi:hypothetical protein
MIGRLNTLLPAVFTLLMTIQGCGGGSGSSTDDPTNTDEPGINSDPEQTSEFAGRTWQLCNQFNATSTLFTEEFRETEFVSIYNTYLNNSCSGTPNTSVEIVSGTYILGGAVTTTGGFSATEIDFHITSAYGAPLPSADQYTLYDIYYIDNDALYYGDVRSDNVENRPDTIDFSDAYILN